MEFSERLTPVGTKFIYDGVGKGTVLRVGSFGVLVGFDDVDPRLVPGTLRSFDGFPEYALRCYELATNFKYSSAHIQNPNINIDLVKKEMTFKQ